ncbi:MAG: PAS domain S-box protein, partial [Dehalococcoidia bacterium]|nr:PAS domain S-box protein [Dehalococcoidia bacterium]
MPKPLRALIVEDSAQDADLTVRLLERDGYEVTSERVEDSTALRTALEGGQWDIVLAEYIVPGFGVLDAIELLRATGLDIPFIVVTGAVGEETAVEAMRAGAHDYVMKGNMHRLAPAIDREIREAESRRERRRAQEALRVKDSVFEASITANSIANADGIIYEANAAFLRIWGYASRDEVIGQPISHFLWSQEEAVAILKALDTTGEWEGDYVAKRKDGSIFAAHGLATVLRDEKGRIAGYQSAVLDVTARRQMEEDLLESRNRFDAVLESISDGVFTLSSSWRYNYINTNGALMVGKTREQLLNKCIWEEFPEAIGSEFDKAYHEVMETRRSRAFVDYYAPLDSWYQLSVYPHPDGISVYYQNVTDLKRAEEAAARQHQIVEAFFQSNVTSMVILDREFNFVRVNEAYARACNRDITEFTGRNHFDMYPSDAKPIFEEVVRSKLPFATHDRPFTFPDQPDRTLTYWDWTLVPILDSLGEVEYLSFCLNEVTERKRAEQALFESEQRLRAVLNSAPITIFATDSRAVFTLHEGKGLERLGMKPGENVGLSALEIYKALPVVEHTGKLTTGEDVIHRVLAGETVEGVTELKGIYFENQFAPMMDNNGRVIGLVGIANDITERKQAEAGSELRTYLLDAAMDSIYLHNRDMEFIYLNEATYQSRGYGKEELMAMGLRSLVAPGYGELIPERMEELFEKGQTTFESAHVRKDGTVMPVECRLRLIEVGGEKLILNVCRDITERKRAEQTLIESEERFRSLFDNMLDGFAYCRMLFDDNDEPHDFAYVDVNDAFEELTGLKNVVGKRVTEVIPGIMETNPELFKIYGTVALTGRPERFETYIQPLERWLLISAYGAGRDHFVAVFENITERRRAEEALQESEKRFRHLIENVSDIITVLDSRGIIRYESPAIERVLGYMPEELVGQSAFELVHPDDIQPVRDLFERTISVPGVSASTDLRYRHRDGSWRKIEVTGIAMMDHQGQAMVVVNARDITERKRAEEALLESEQRLRAVLNSAPITIFATDSRAVFTLHEGKGLEKLGMKPGENVGLSALEIYKSLPVVEHTGKLTTGEDVIHRVLAGETVEGITESEGTYLDNQFAPIRDNNGSVIGLVGIANDITERRQAEAEIVVLRRAVESSGEVIFLTDREGVFTYVNPEFTRLYGYAAGEVVGRVTPRILNSGVAMPQDYEVFWKTLLGGKVDKGEWVNKAKDGRLVEVDGSASPILDDGGNIVGFLAVQRDISERKRSEEAIGREGARSEALLRVAERLNAELSLSAVLKAVCEEAAAALKAPT